jgi:hypothetical protein
MQRPRDGQEAEPEPSGDGSEHQRQLAHLWIVKRRKRCILPESSAAVSCGS